MGDIYGRHPPPVLSVRSVLYFFWTLPPATTPAPAPMDEQEEVEANPDPPSPLSRFAFELLLFSFVVMVFRTILSCSNRSSSLLLATGYLLLTTSK